jgi:pimeloyl-ACP methyl ester carboxylesterase
MVLDYPELIDGLIMVAPSIAPELEPHEWFRAPLATPFLKWLMPRSLRASNDEIYKLKPDLENLVPRWKDIRVPVIVIQGSQDSLVHPDNAAFRQTHDDQHNC